MDVDIFTKRGITGDDYTADVFRTRAVSPEVAAERGYRRYGGELGLDPIFEADARYTDDLFRGWLRHWTRGGKRTGWVMPKYAVPGSAFDAPLAQLRPDEPVLSRVSHSHAGMSPKTLARHLGKAEWREDHTALADPDAWHVHLEPTKYLIPKGPHGKRWDTHPRCTRDRFLAAERVFLHLEGTLKLDALVSAGEVGADVPSVTLWDRRPGELSELDFPAQAAGWPAGVRLLGRARGTARRGGAEGRASGDRAGRLPPRQRARAGRRRLRSRLARQPVSCDGGVQPARQSARTR